MNYTQIISDLRRELKRIEEAIQALEECERQKVEGRRGRKSMGDAERIEVSERMKRYWAARRHAPREIGEAREA